MTTTRHLTSTKSTTTHQYQYYDMCDEWSSVPSNPSFSDLSTNSIAVVPLLAESREGGRNAHPKSRSPLVLSQRSSLLNNPHTDKSFKSLMAAFSRYSATSDEEQHDMMVHASRQRREEGIDDSNVSSSGAVGNSASGMAYQTTTNNSLSTATLLIPNSQLTRPGDWRYDATPLVNFDWNSGCQRLHFFDARPTTNRYAFERIQNPTITAPWSDLIPSRTTMAVVGVLNLKDCPNTDSLLQAEYELREWAVRYSTVEGTMANALLHGDEGEDSHTMNGKTNDNNNSSSTTNTSITTRLFVFDSFDESCQTRVDLSKSTLGMDLIAFPPSDEQHSHMLDLHLKIVVNDLAVAFFRTLENRIQESDDIGKAAATTATTNSKSPFSAASIGGGGSGTTSTTMSSSGGDGTAIGNSSSGGARPGGRAAAAAVSALANFANSASGAGAGGTSSSNNADLSSHGTTEDDDSESGSSINAASVGSSGATSSGAGGGGGGGGGLVRGMIRNAMNAATSSAASSAFNATSAQQAAAQAFGTTHRLLTPLDDIIDMHGISMKTLEAYQKREIGRREKHSADLSLMAGSPLDAYERYNRAAELTKAARDPLWYAASLQGCAASFIAMADHGGHGVDTYLENNFRMPDEILTIINTELSKSSDSTRRQTATMASLDKSKTTLPGAVFFLCEEALGILSKHPKLAPLYAELMLRLAVYTAEWEDIHRLCRWGYGPYCNAGEMGSTKRYQSSSMAKLLESVEPNVFHEQISKDTLAKCRKVIELLHKAVCTGALDARTRSDVALISAKLCLKGITACRIPNGNDPSPSMLLREQMYNSYPTTTTSRLRLPRKAAFFTTVAAESMSRCTSKDSSQRAANLWIALSQLYGHTENAYLTDSTNYAWVALRIAVLHGLTQQVDSLVAEQAYEMLLVLLSEISPDLLPHQRGKRLKMPSNMFSEDLLHRGISSGGNSSVTSGTSNDLDLIKPSTTSKSTSMNTSSNGRTSRGTGLFGAVGAVGSRTSNTIAHQARWADDPQISQAVLPLVELTDLVKRHMTKGSEDPILQHVSTIYQTLHLMTFSCVRPKVTFEDCAISQQRFIHQLIHLRSTMPTKTSGLRLNLTQGMTTTMGSSSSSSSSSSFGSSSLHNNHNMGSNNNTAIPPPLVVRSASVVKADSQLLLERTKASGYQGRNVGMSMQTFFNPYAAKKSATSGGIQTTLIAEGEERTVEVVFENRLSVELDIPNCRLEFDPIGSKRIEAAPLSFVVPPKSKHFCVYFPFIVVPSNLLPSNSDERTNDMNVEEDDAVKDQEGGSNGTSIRNMAAKVDAFQLLGLRVTCMNRCFSVSFDGGAGSSSSSSKSLSSSSGGIVDVPQFVPNPASMYPLLKNVKKVRQPGGGGGGAGSSTKDFKTGSGGDSSSAMVPFQTVVRVETVPAQPTLNVSFITSETPLEDAAIVPVHLSDGEIYSIPPFRLQTDFGSSGQGRIERLQLIAAGLPGLAEEVLFDTEGLEAARKDDENFDDDEMDNDDNHTEDDFEELMEEDGLPPLRMKVLTEDLHLGSINDKDKAQKEGSVVKFQIAAAHDMGNQLANGGNVRIRFRYRGASPNEATEIWRRTEVRLRIVRVKGPRISSLSFRPDLSWGSAYSELSHSLVQQRRRIDALPSSESEKHAQRLAALSSKPPLVDVDGIGGKGAENVGGSGSGGSGGGGSSGNGGGDNGKENTTVSSILHRVGTDAATNVSGGEAVVLMAVANETNSTIILSNREGRVGGFQGSPMPTIRVTSGVSVKIPVVIQRIERLDDKTGEVTDIVSELIARTALTWESLVGDGEANKRVRRGRVRIPSRCLREIIDEHGSFASRICKAPITLSVDIGCKSNENEVMLEPGGFVNAVARVKVNDWVPVEAISRCQLMLEFCCAPKFAAGARNSSTDTSTSSGMGMSEGNVAGAPPYMWCGQLRRTFDGLCCVQSKKEGTDMIHQAKLTFLTTGSYAISACVKISLPSSSREAIAASTMILEGGRKQTPPPPEEVWWAPRAETVLVEAANL